MNSAIRNRHDLARFLPFVYEAEKALAALPSVASGTVAWRGMSQVPAKLRQPGVYTFAQLSSFSEDRVVAEGFATGATPCLIKVRLCRAYNIQSVSTYPAEKELMCPFHARFVVDAPPVQENRLLVISLRQLPSSIPIFARKRADTLAVLRSAEDYFAKQVAAATAKSTREAIRHAVKAISEATVRAAVLATVKAGKSSTINGLTRCDMCPARTMPETLCVTVVRHPRDNTIATPYMFDDTGRKITGSDIAQFIREVNNRSRLERIDIFSGKKKVPEMPPLPVVTVHSNLPFARTIPANVELIDTPGGNEAAMSTVPQFHANNADVLIYVVDLCKLGTSDESALLRQLRSWLFKVKSLDSVVIVLNKKDEWSAREAKSLDQISDELVALLLDKDPLDGTQIQADERARRVLRGHVVPCAMRYFNVAIQFEPYVSTSFDTLAPDRLVAVRDYASLTLKAVDNEDMRVAKLQRQCKNDPDDIKEDIESFKRQSNVATLERAVIECLKAHAERKLQLELNVARLKLESSLALNLMTAREEAILEATRRKINNLVATLRGQVNDVFRKASATCRSKFTTFCEEYPETHPLKRLLGFPSGGLKGMASDYVTIHDCPAHRFLKEVSDRMPPNIDWTREFLSGKGQDVYKWAVFTNTYKPSPVDMFIDGIYTVVRHFAYPEFRAAVSRINEALAQFHDQLLRLLVGAFADMRSGGQAAADVPHFGKGGTLFLWEAHEVKEHCRNTSTSIWCNVNATNAALIQGAVAIIDDMFVEVQAANIENMSKKIEAEAMSFLQSESLHVANGELTADLQSFFMSIKELDFIPEWS